MDHARGAHRRASRLWEEAILIAESVWLVSSLALEIRSIKTGRPRKGRSVPRGRKRHQEIKKTSSNPHSLTENRSEIMKSAAVDSPLQNHAPGQRFPDIGRLQADHAESWRNAK